MSNIRQRYTDAQYEKASELFATGFSQKQVSLNLNIPYDTVRGWLRRGHKPLLSWTTEEKTAVMKRRKQTIAEYSPERRTLVSMRHRQVKLGPKNPNWKNSGITAEAGRYRARTILKPTKGLEVHHKDGNPLNNDPENIELLTRKEHMVKDGRLQSFITCTRQKPRRATQ